MLVKAFFRTPAVIERNDNFEECPKYLLSPAWILDFFSYNIKVEKERYELIKTSFGRRQSEIYDSKFDNSAVETFAA